MRRLLVLSWLSLVCALAVVAQEEAGCAADELSLQQSTLASFLTLDFAADPDAALANLFRLGALYQTLALECGYAPNAAEVDRLLEQALMFASLDDLIAAQSVGADVATILLELDEVYGDPLQGQLLYNGLEPALGGVALGCSGCHENEAVAPLTAGTWTRVQDIRLALPQFAGYSHRQFLVESIVQPMSYITPDYAGMMPEFYGGQLTTQQLADLVAFLDSQDQFLEDE
ncbi:MAG: hypothetical protein OXG85_06300 [Chloroflexi bacterium]|nr:hypothetical protein [Chloroflexota bacterium]